MVKTPEAKTCSDHGSIYPQDLAAGSSLVTVPARWLRGGRISLVQRDYSLLSSGAFEAAYDLKGV